MNDTATAYLETFGCSLETDEGHSHPGDCDWCWSCSTCGMRLDGIACPDHAPRDVPGLQLVDCQAEPPHLIWVTANDGYGAGCMSCQLAAEVERHAGCRHSHHKAWRRWRITHKLSLWAYGQGFSKGSGTSWGGGCDGCLTGFQWGRSGYVLGQRREWWHCLLRRRHLFVPVECAGWMCGRCHPDPDEAP